MYLFWLQACRNGLQRHLDHLLFYGADIHAQNNSGSTALHVCAIHGQVGCERCHSNKLMCWNAVHVSEPAAGHVRLSWQPACQPGCVWILWCWNFDKSDTNACVHACSRAGVAGNDYQCTTSKNGLFRLFLFTYTYLTFPVAISLQYKNVFDGSFVTDGMCKDPSLPWSKEVRSKQGKSHTATGNTIHGGL